MTENYWESRWQSDQTGWDIGFAAPAIIEFFKYINNPTASILIPGCGNAYEAEALWELGYKNLTLVDISATAIAKVKNRFHNKPEVKILHVDFFYLNEHFDYVIEQTFFCALLPAQRPDYVRKMAEILKPSGQLVGLLFDREFDINPPYGGNKEAYYNLFASDFNIIKLERAYNSIPQRAGTELFIHLKIK